MTFFLPDTKENLPEKTLPSLLRRRRMSVQLFFVHLVKAVFALAWFLVAET